jgi:hypothetical protein
LILDLTHFQSFNPSHSGTPLAAFYPGLARQTIMDNRDDHYSPVVNGLSDFATDALSFTPEPARGSPRDAAWLRWLKYTSVIIFPALVFGLGFLLEDYLLESNGQTYRQRQCAALRIQRDSLDSMKLRFIIGAGLGGGLGLIYVVRCMVRKIDP